MWRIVGYSYIMGIVNINYTLINDSIEFYYHKDEIVSKYKIMIEKNKLFLENDSVQLIYYKLPENFDVQKLFDQNDPEFDKNYHKFLKRARGHVNSV